MIWKNHVAQDILIYIYSISIGISISISIGIPTNRRKIFMIFFRRSVTAMKFKYVVGMFLQWDFWRAVIIGTLIFLCIFGSLERLPEYPRERRIIISELNIVPGPSPLQLDNKLEIKIEK